MIVPQYWAEAKLRKKINGRQLTLKRVGWSDESQEDAQKNAEERVADAFADAEQGKQVRRIDHKVPYNGAEGLPIREEIISHHGDAVITRNSYGALCLNTPDVLFADVDFFDEPDTKTSLITFLILLVIVAAFAYFQSSWLMLLGGTVVAMVFTSTVSTLVRKYVVSARGGHDQIALSAIKSFSAQNPSWHLRLYRTPHGYRVLVMHSTFDPLDGEVEGFFKTINADPMYQRMCKNQRCFRARLSPKPWRIGVDHLRPQPGVWPIKAERMADRAKWVAHYNQKAANYASCKFVEQLGSNLVDAKAKAVRQVHDEYCKATQDLVLA